MQDFINNIDMTVVYTMLLMFAVFLCSRYKHRINIDKIKPYLSVLSLLSLVSKDNKAQQIAAIARVVDDIIDNKGHYSLDDKAYLIASTRRLAQSLSINVTDKQLSDIADTIIELHIVNQTSKTDVVQIIADGLAVKTTPALSTE